jgi:hypothetical protein
LEENRRRQVKELGEFPDVGLAQFTLSRENIGGDIARPEYRQ